jgi:hypothetical protein
MQHHEPSAAQTHASGRVEPLSALFQALHHAQRCSSLWTWSSRATIATICFDAGSSALARVSARCLPDKFQSQPDARQINSRCPPDNPQMLAQTSASVANGLDHRGGPRSARSLCCAFRYGLRSWLLVHTGPLFPLSVLSFYFRGVVRHSHECIIMYMRSCMIMVYEHVHEIHASSCTMSNDT